MRRAARSRELSSRMPRPLALAALAASLALAVAAPSAVAYPFAGSTSAVAPTAGKTVRAVAAGFLDAGDVRDVAAVADDRLELARGLGDAGEDGDLDYASLLSVPAPSAVDVVVRDLDRDGRDDVVWVDSAGLHALLRTATGAGSAGAGFDRVDVATPEWALRLAVADFVPGGGLDIATAPQSGSAVRLYAGGTDGSITPYASTTVPDVTNGSIAPANLDGSGAPEIAFGAVRVVCGSGGGVCRAQTQPGGLRVQDGALVPYDTARPRTAYSASLVPVPGAAGVDDLLLLTGAPSFGVGIQRIANDGQGVLSSAGRGVTFDATPYPGTALNVADLDGDGALDGAALIDGSVRVARASGTVDTFPARQPNALALADMDGDGLLDLVSGDDDGVTVRVHAASGLLTATPAALDLGSRVVADGPSAAQSTTVRNTGTGPAKLSSAPTLTGAAPDRFELLTGQAGDCAAGLVLAPDDTCTVRVRFVPQETGARSAAIRVASNAPPLSVPLSAVGTERRLRYAVFEQERYRFGEQQVDDGATDYGDLLRIENVGSAPVTYDATSLRGPDSQDFVLQPTAEGDCTHDLVLAVGASCSVRFAFDPTSPGDKAATLAFTSDAPERTVTLAGTGVRRGATLTPPVLDFGDALPDGRPGTALSAVLRNTGTSELDVRLRDASGELAPDELGPFTRDRTVEDDCGAVLPPGASCRLRYTFVPGGLGRRSVPLTVDVDGRKLELGLELRGRGVETLPTPVAEPTPDAPVTATTPPAPGPTVTPGPAAAPPTTAGSARIRTSGTASLRGRRLRTPFLVSCPAGARRACAVTGTATAVRGRTTLARGRTAVPAGRTARVTLTLTTAGRRQLRRARRPTVTLRLQVVGPDGVRRTATRRVTVRR